MRVLGFNIIEKNSAIFNLSLLGDKCVQRSQFVRLGHQKHIESWQVGFLSLS